MANEKHTSALGGLNAASKALREFRETREDAVEKDMAGENPAGPTDTDEKED